MKTLKISVILMSLLLANCSQKSLDAQVGQASLSPNNPNNPSQEATTLSQAEAELSVEAAVTSMGSMMDEFRSGSRLGLQSQSSLGASGLSMQRAMSPTCAPAFMQACNNGVKEMNFSNCNVLGRVEISGNISLDFSNTSCGIQNAGDQVVRTYDVSFLSTRRNIRLEASSADQADYRGEVYGGGGMLTRTNTGYEIEILGDHRLLDKLDKGENDPIEVSSRTLEQPIVIDGDIQQRDLRLRSGVLEVNHNTAQYTAVIAANNLQWTSSCCHPIGGSMTLDVTGSRSGSGSLTFNACGDATLDINGNVRDIDLDICN